MTGDPENAIGLELGRQFDDLYVKLVSKSTAAFYSGIDNLLKIIASSPRVVVAALSNACGSYARAVVHVNDFDNLFKVAYGADDVPKAKPAPDGLIAICEQLKLNPKRCVYVGDSPSDGKAAEAAGMASIGVTWGSHSLTAVQPEFNKVVHSVSELEETLIKFINCIDE